MAAPSVDDLARSFERYLRAGNKSPRTIETYLEAVAGFTGFLSATSRRSLDEARREDVEAWIGALLARWKPATAHNRYRGLHAFYRWLEDEEDIPSPMAKMNLPSCRTSPSRSLASRSCAPCSPSAPARTSTPAATPRC
jgi:site-specific recombinase XerD